MKTQILGLGGTTSATSTSRRALEHALAGATEAGAAPALIDPAELPLPLFRPDVAPNDAVATLITAVRGADGFLWSSPLYHGSVSAQFKNAIDWLELLSKDAEPYLHNRVVGLIMTAGGGQALAGIDAMQSMVRALRGWAAPRVVAVSHATKLLDPAAPDERTLLSLRGLGADVAQAAARLRRP